jgi:hypothetical protein
VSDRSNTARIAKRRQCRAERRGQNGVKFRIDLEPPMDAATSLDDAVRQAQDIMWGPGSARAAAVVKLRDLLWSAKMTQALGISSDNCLAFALRQSRIALADASAWPDKTPRYCGRSSTIPLSTLPSGFRKRRTRRDEIIRVPDARRTMITDDVNVARSKR